MSNNSYPVLVNESYVSLTTYRKNGAGVATPVWFVQDGDKLYITTQDNSGKVKRLRHTAQVALAPCTARGVLTGDKMSAQAIIVPEGDSRIQHADKLLTQKYGLLKRFFDVVSFFSRARRCVIEVSPA